MLEQYVKMSLTDLYSMIDDCRNNKGIHTIDKGLDTYAVRIFTNKKNTKYTQYSYKIELEDVGYGEFSGAAKVKENK